MLLGGDASREVIWLAVLEFIGDFPGEDGKWSTKHRLSSFPAIKVSHRLFIVLTCLTGVMSVKIDVDDRCQVYQG